MREQMGAVHLSPTPVGDMAGRVWAGSPSYMRVWMRGVPTASGQIAMYAMSSELGRCVVLACPSEYRCMPHGSSQGLIETPDGVASSQL
jgi:hypothetical protein